MSNSTSQWLLDEATHDLYFNIALISGTCKLTGIKVLVIYDYFLTLPAEVSEIWTSEFTAAHALFYVTRYSYIVYTLLRFVLNFLTNPSQKFCQVVFYNTLAWIIPPHLGLYAIFTLRTYAIYRKSWIILFVFGLTSMATCVGGVIDVALVPQVIRHNDGFHTICDINLLSPAFPTYSRLQLVAQILSLLLDILLFGFTLAKTIHHTIEMKKVGLGDGLGYFILRDGALMFGVLGTILFFDQTANWLEVTPSIANSVALILASRLVLNLRQVSRSQCSGGRTLGSIESIRDPVFATNSFLGNIGAQLRVGPDDDDHIEEIFTDVEPDAKKCGAAEANEITEDGNSTVYFRTQPAHFIEAEQSTCPR
ncbi:hypothetical protein BD410DRAFT_795700 [Rickenella mellea]|uniref:DUF6533 domain-containing protein n=1 Tax=Rickenella mellea TaxID=50990 RepID=A0A4Y7PLS7_9AGAM|nr:hypothetical protein BD410DRAFT_795700 [Rickenella mellea]